MKVVMIHEVYDWMLNIDLSDFDVITFDDGLYSQYTNHKHFLKFNKPMHFFISTNIICPEEVFQNKEVFSCRQSHEYYFNYGDLTNYMKWSQIKEIERTKNCFIGGHSHAHIDLRKSQIKDVYNSVRAECELMLKTFKQQNIDITSFAYPYNFNALGYESTLRSKGINQFFGHERTAIEELK